MNNRSENPLTTLSIRLQMLNLMHETFHSLSEIAMYAGDTASMNYVEGLLAEVHQQIEVTSQKLHVLSISDYPLVEAANMQKLDRYQANILSDYEFYYLLVGLMEDVLLTQTNIDTSSLSSSSSDDEASYDTVLFSEGEVIAADPIDETNSLSSGFHDSEDDVVNTDESDNSTSYSSSFSASSSSSVSSVSDAESSELGRTESESSQHISLSSSSSSSTSGSSSSGSTSSTEDSDEENTFSEISLSSSVSSRSPNLKASPRPVSPRRFSIFSSSDSESENVRQRGAFSSSSESASPSSSPIARRMVS